MVFSNEEWSLKHDVDASLSDVFSGLDRHIAVSIRRWMDASVS